METSILSLIPIILTIGLAIKTRNVLVSLFAGVFSGVLILSAGHPITAVKSMIGDYVMAQLLDSYNAGIIVLLVFIGGFVALIEKSGGAEAFARCVAHFVNTRCKTQIAAWIAGIAVFFSELGTPLIVGPIFTPIFEKMRISKEKLAWIIDTTASPVCVLIPFIGWGVYSMGLIKTELEALHITGIFSTIGNAEELEKKSMVLDNHTPLVVVLAPLLVLFVTLFGILAPQHFPIKQVPGGDFRIALITGYLFAAITMIVLMAFYKVKPLKEGISIYIKGLGKLFECILMLVLAWGLSSVGKALGTSEYIVQMAEGNIPAWSIPAIIFIIGALMSFSTGTSWGTFAIVMPIAIPMAVALGAPLYVTIAAVLSGGLFGDHCSPVSDTTILAATGSSCGLMEHMWTQLPYAMICASVSIVGFIAAGITDSVIVTVVCAVLLVIVYNLAGKLKGVSVKNLNIKDIEKLEAEEASQSV